MQLVVRKRTDAGIENTDIGANALSHGDGRTPPVRPVSGHPIYCLNRRPVMLRNSKSRLVGATLLTATWLLVAAAIAQRSLMHHGLLENGPWFEISAVAVSMLTMVLIGAVLFPVLCRRHWQTVRVRPAATK